MAEPGHEVRRPPQRLLEQGRGVGDQGRVEAHARHHREVVALGQAVAADPSEVHRAVIAGEPGEHRRLEIVGQAQVAREQIAGAGGKDHERDATAGQAGHDGHHRAVAPAREH